VNIFLQEIFLYKNGPLIFFVLMVTIFQSLILKNKLVKSDEEIENYVFLMRAIPEYISITITS